MTRCERCGEPISGPTTGQSYEITGWIVDRATQGMSANAVHFKKYTGAVRCARCTKLLRQGINPGQSSMTVPDSAPSTSHANQYVCGAFAPPCHGKAWPPCGRIRGHDGPHQRVRERDFRVIAEWTGNTYSLEPPAPKRDRR
jgi:ribosomal protein S27E